MRAEEKTILFFAAAILFFIIIAVVIADKNNASKTEKGKLRDLISNAEVIKPTGSGIVIITPENTAAKKDNKIVSNDQDYEEFIKSKKASKTILPEDKILINPYPLFVAMKYTDYNWVKKILDNDLYTQKDKEDTSLIIYAILYEWNDIAEQLINKGFPYKPEAQHYSPMAFAEEMGRKKIYSILGKTSWNPFYSHDIIERYNEALSSYEKGKISGAIFEDELIKAYKKAKSDHERKYGPPVIYEMNSVNSNNARERR